VESALLFIANTAEFRLKEIPGAMSDDMRVALAEKFVTCGFLEVIEE
jgi:hypothetical protein